MLLPASVLPAIRSTAFFWSPLCAKTEATQREAKGNTHVVGDRAQGGSVEEVAVVEAWPVAAVEVHR